MLSFQQIEYIITLSEELHFQRASERCFVTQPTLSMQLKKAEDSLGALIFDRSRQPLQLTKFGEQLIPILRDTMHEYDKIDLFAERSKGLFKEEVRIAIIPTIAGYLLPGMYQEWKDQLKNIQLIIEELKSEEIIDAMEERRIDMAILSGPYNNPKMRTIPLFQEEIMAYFPSFSDAIVSTNKLHDEHPWLLNQGNCLRTQMMDFCSINKQDGAADWDYEGGNIQLLEKMVKSFGGYTLVPENHISKMNKDYKTIVSNDNEVPAREVIALVSNKKVKWEYMEQVIRSVQLKYGAKSSNEQFKLLNWQ